MNFVDKKYNISIASCFRAELQYMKEWIEYHLLIGVEHFYLANNDIYKELANDLLKPYIEKGIVTLIQTDEKKHVQIKITPELVKLADTKWLAVIDLDEYIYPEEPTGNIYNTIRHFEQINVCAIGLNWCIFGNNDVIFPAKLLTQTFVKRAKRTDLCNRTIKFLIRPEYVQESLGHSFIFKKDTFAVNSNKRPIYADKDNKYKVENPCWKRLRLNHYPIKSIFDFVNKIGRGYMGKTKMFENEEHWSKHFAEYNRNDIKDFGMLTYGPELEKRLSIS